MHMCMLGNDVNVTKSSKVYITHNHCLHLVRILYSYYYIQILFLNSSIKYIIHI